MMKNQEIAILDCTLRDGGYYNNWDFDAEIVKTYLDAMADAEIDYVELGLRQFKNESFLGGHAYTTNEFLKHFDLPNGPLYGVMIDAKTILSQGGSQAEGIDLLFMDAEDEKIDLVRIAAHHSEVAECQPMASRLKAKGYRVGLNIMQISACPQKEVAAFGRIVDSWECVDVLYFADSLGSMRAEDVERVYSNLREFWSGDIGFHSHNNLGQGIANVQKAIDVGCRWVDATITGMGRGAGNAQTEYLLLEMNKIGYTKNCSKVFDLSLNVFEPMRQKHKWGPSLSYYLAALESVHPTYVQKMNSDKSIPSTQVLDIISDIGKMRQPSKFDGQNLDIAKSNIESQCEVVDGEAVPQFLKGREVILVAQTDAAERYETAICDYAVKRNAVIMSINYPSKSAKLDFDYVFISHNEKFRFEKDQYLKTEFKFIAPKQLFSGVDIEVEHDYGLRIEKGEFKNSGSFACIPYRLTLAYAVSFCLDAGATDIKLAGVSGVNMDVERHKEMQDLINILTANNVKLVSVTPSSFAIDEQSVYAI